MYNFISKSDDVLLDVRGRARCKCYVTLKAAKYFRKYFEVCNLTHLNDTRLGGR